MATIASITFGNDKLAALCRGLDKQAFDADPPATVAEGEQFIRSRLIDRLRVAFGRGQRFNHEDALVTEPLDDITA